MQSEHENYFCIHVDLLHKLEYAGTRHVQIHHLAQKAAPYLSNNNNYNQTMILLKVPGSTVITVV